ncbi:MAG TPA: transposase [Verrucomicrobiales bacterium]|nr:transposase [Verrucomicrobiae bacterium]MCP5555250.1 transposase [Akkermansiaceae bacterium]HRX52913.1 transposase [Verrucomicrobiales bacterium]
MTDCIQLTIAFQDLGGRKVDADIKGGNVSADGGVLLLREIDLSTGLIDQLAECFTDHRCQALIENSGPDLLRQRILGLAKNAALLRHLDATMFRAKADACMRGGWCTCFCEFEYHTLKSWSRSRQVIGKTQVNPKGENPRFIVTNLSENHDLRQPERLYREFYCARGDAENRIKEQQLDLFADRMSCEVMSANQLRLWISTFAYLLLIDPRETGLKGNKTYAKASPGIIRHHLLKIAAVVTVSVRRVLVRWSSSFRFQPEVVECWRSLCAAPS